MAFGDTARFQQITGTLLLMWRLKVGKESVGSPFLQSLNDFAGRLVWEFDPQAGSDRERDLIERARRFFEQNRNEHPHSADVPLRRQLGGLEDVKRRKRQAWILMLLFYFLVFEGMISTE